MWYSAVRALGALTRCWQWRHAAQHFSGAGLEEGALLSSSSPWEGAGTGTADGDDHDTASAAKPVKWFTREVDIVLLTQQIQAETKVSKLCYVISRSNRQQDIIVLIIMVANLIMLS